MDSLVKPKTESLNEDRLGGGRGVVEPQKLTLGAGGISQSSDSTKHSPYPTKKD
jgi:hypothetical protein